MEIISFIAGFLLGRISNKVHIRNKNYDDFDDFWEEFELNEEIKEWMNNGK